MKRKAEFSIENDVLKLKIDPKFPDSELTFISNSIFPVTKKGKLMLGLRTGKQKVTK